MSANPTSSSTADLVIDASVAAKWFFDEAGSKEARALLRSQSRLYAPAYITVEIATAILRCYRENKLTEASARASLESWDRLLTQGIVRLIPTDDLICSARELSIQIRHAFADCLYLAAGLRLNAAIVTADRTLHDRGQAHHPQITLLQAPSDDHR